MKCSILVLLFFGSLSVWAEMEHVPGIGSVPEKQKLSSARACFREIDDKGCGHPRDDQEFFISCLDENKNNLTPSCKSFFHTLYGKRKST